MPPCWLAAWLLIQLQCASHASTRITPHPRNPRGSSRVLCPQNHLINCNLIMLFVLQNDISFANDCRIFQRIPAYSSVLSHTLMYCRILSCTLTYCRISKPASAFFPQHFQQDKIELRAFWPKKVSLSDNLAFPREQRRAGHAFPFLRRQRHLDFLPQIATDAA